MPLYEYRCESCGHTFEKIQKFSDPREDICPECGGPVKKLVSSPAIQFKGSGWYITDYAKKPPSESSAKSDGGSTSTKTNSATKGDSAAARTDTNTGSSGTAAPKTSSGDSAKKD